MMIENTQSRMYMCAFVNKATGKVDKLILKPKENFVDSKLLKSLVEHPGFNERVKLGLLKITDAPKAAKKAKNSEAKATAEAEAEAKATAEDFLK